MQNPARESSGGKRRLGADGWCSPPACSRGVHRWESAALVLTDLLANPEPGKVNRLLLLLLKSIGGIAPPYGAVSCDLRLNFTWRHRHELEAAVQRCSPASPSASSSRTAVGTTQTAPLNCATHLGGP